MIITCPNCTTRYRLSASAVGAKGQRARCTNCGHQWMMTRPLIEQALQEKIAERLGPDAVDKADQPQAPAADAGSGTSPEVGSETAPAENEPTQPSTPTGDEASATAASMEIAETSAAENEPDQTQEEARDLAPLAATDDALESAGDGSDREDQDDNEIDPEGRDNDVDADEPIPSVFMDGEEDVDFGEDDTQPKRRRWIAPVAIGAAVLIAGSLGALALARDSIMAAFPATGSWYAMVGLGQAPGTGLSIGDVTSAREDTPQGEAIIVEGAVTNVSEEPKALPHIRVTLFDVNDEELQDTTVTPERTELAPGESLTFLARLEDPNPTARRIKVTFAAPAAGGDSPGHSEESSDRPVDHQEPHSANEHAPVEAPGGSDGGQLGQGASSQH